MHRLYTKQQQRNRETSGSWERFAPHRERTTQLICDTRRQGSGRLVVLGAGNCNDLDLARLQAVFPTIDLYDLDDAALEAGVARQKADRPGLTRHGNLDLSGVLRHLSTCREDPPDADVARCIDAVRGSSPLPRDTPCETAVSTCLLTQMMDAVRMAVGEQHPRFLELVLALRLRHLQLLCELVEPNGTLLLVTDFISSATCPELPHVPDARLATTLIGLIESRNFFTGVNPFAIARLFETDPTLAAATGSAEIAEPWRWDLGPRVYAVTAIVARRKG